MARDADGGGEDVVMGDGDDVDSVSRLRHQEAVDKANDDTSTGMFPVVERRRRGRGRRVAKSINRSIGSKIVTSTMVFLLCALVGFAYMVQSRNTTDSYSTLSEDELVRLIDESSTQISQLESQKSRLESQLSTVKSAADKQEESRRIAREIEQSTGILSGRLATHGKGVRISVYGDAKAVNAALMFNLIEELRNAGAEAIELNGVRVVTSTYVADADGGLSCDGRTITSPYTIGAIGDPNALQNAITIAGGVGQQLRARGATVDVAQKDDVIIDSVRESPSYQYAKTLQ